MQNKINGGVNNSGKKNMKSNADGIFNKDNTLSESNKDNMLSESNKANTLSESEKYSESLFFWGRISTLVAIAFFIAFPLFVSIYYDAWPNWEDFLTAMLGVAPIFWIVGAIEAFTFAPMLGIGGTYLGFVTGNLTAIKVPVALSAMESMGVASDSDEGEVVSTIAIAVSSITTVIILFVGMIMLTPLQPILQSEVLKPAFDNILPALFGGLATVFFAKNAKIAIAPVVLMVILFIAVPKLAGAVSLMVPIGAIFAIICSRVLYKRGKL